MLRPVTVLMDFDRYAPMRLVNFARNTVVGLTGNELFPSPDVPLTQITAAALLLEQKQQIVESTDGSIEATAQRDVAEKDLIAKLKRNGRYVTNLAYNDKQKILSANYLASAEESHPAERGEQAELTVTAGRDAGTAIIEFKPVSGAKAYVVILVPAAGSGPALITHTGVIVRGGTAPVDVLIITDTHRKLTVDNLVSGIRYRAVGYTLNAAGPSGLSAEQTFVTQ